MIPINDTLNLDERELRFEFFAASSGPGGQNVNKVATAVRLYFDGANSPSLPPSVRRRLMKQPGLNLNSQGSIVVSSQRYREQGRNRADAVEKLMDLIRKAAVRPKHRRPTKPTRASAKRRIESKVKRGQTKRLRGKVGRDD